MDVERCGAPLKEGTAVRAACCRRVRRSWKMELQPACHPGQGLSMQRRPVAQSVAERYVGPVSGLNCYRATVFAQKRDRLRIDRWQLYIATNLHFLRVWQLALKIASQSKATGMQVGATIIPGTADRRLRNCWPGM
jgi:hypothetical protein